MGVGQQFENEIVDIFNTFFKKNDIRAIAYRFPQVFDSNINYGKQFFDVMIDSIRPQYYIGIECKNIDVSKKGCYLPNVIRKQQLLTQIRFTKISGRIGFYCLNLRNGDNIKTYLIPINSVFTLLKGKNFDEKLTLENGGRIIRTNDKLDLSFLNNHVKLLH